MLRIDRTPYRLVRRFAYCVATLAVLIPCACGGPIKLEKAFLCDDFAEGKCTAPPPEGGIYRFSLPAEKTKTWFDFAYHMYFHSRQTPGMRVNFSRGLNTQEESTRTNAHCVYKISKGDKFAEDHMEGLRWDENGSGLWCFDYLGTMLVKFHKKYGTIQTKPTPDFFPVTLNIKLEGGPVSAEQQETIYLDWTAAP